MSGKFLTGIIVSTKMTGTAVVAVEMPKRHSIYEKTIKSTRRFKASNKLGAKLGDEVYMQECPPFGKDVNHVITSVVNKTEAK